MSHLFVCFVALVIQGSAMAKFWPLHHSDGTTEMGHVPYLSSHPNLYLVKISGRHAPSPTSCTKCFSPILSHTLIVVVQWPKFGHSTTLNNKGYNAHKEMGHVPYLSSHPNLYLVKVIRLTRPLSHELC